MINVFCCIIFEQSCADWSVGEACSHINACAENKIELLINVMRAGNHCYMTGF